MKPEKYLAWEERHQDRAIVEAFRATKEGGWESMLYSVYRGMEVSLVVESVGMRIPFVDLYGGIALAEPEPLAETTLE